MTTRSTHSPLHHYLSSQYVDFDLEKPTDRLRSLYSDFSKLKLINSYGYESNVSYWRTVILDSNAHGYLGTSEYCLAFDANELPDSLERVGMGKPLSIDTVISSMQLKGDLMHMDQFMQRYTPTSWFAWMYEAAVKPMKISWRVIGTNNKQQAHLMVVLSNVKKIADRALRTYYLKPTKSTVDHVMTFSDFREQYGTYDSVKLTDADLWLILYYMSSELGVAVDENVRGYGKTYAVIKFPEKHDTKMIAATINEHDKAMISLKTTCKALHHQADELQSKIELFLQMAKENRAKNRKAQALYALKRKKQLEAILERRLQALETVETMLMKIEASQNDLQVIQAFNVGADALRGVLKSNDLSVSSVEETMQRMQNALEDQKEVEDAIAMGTEETLQIQGIADESELEQELEAIQSFQEKQKKEAQRVELPAPIDTESELARLDQVLASLKRSSLPPIDERPRQRVRELA
ncbi:hypothetical protein EC973_001023 [Apophysomyces ossiformis]|uniref:Uncharacterized protein n=1 Tax=Apophysomyces ossiformis TaxID=679940 RepID=A0A8H7BRT6_9FUNG|nr:hypothetical protein EC973_001023 [Apophysomyces ossiformis]